MLFLVSCRKIYSASSLYTHSQTSFSAKHNSGNVWSPVHMFRICIQGFTYMFFWHIFIRLMCFYLHILQHTILSFYFRPWLPNTFTHFFRGHTCQKNIFIYWISSAEALLKSQDMLHCYHHIQVTQNQQWSPFAHRNSEAEWSHYVYWLSILSSNIHNLIITQE